MRPAIVLRLLGQAMMWVGALLLLFVAYQLWGTGLAEARAQDDLADEFSALLEDRNVAPTSSTTSSTVASPASSTTTVATTTTLPPVTFAPAEDGDAVARLVIPDIGVDKIVVEGVGRSDLQRGPGHYPGTPMPGQPGNAAIAGHRTTYGAPFNRIDELEPGDEIFVSTLQGVFTYEVAGTAIVEPTQVDVVTDQGDDRLTLTSCHPKYSAAQRIVVSATLVAAPGPAPPSTTTSTAPAAPDVDELPDEDVPTADLAAAPITHLDGDSATGSWTPVVLWGAVVAAIWLVVFFLSRRWRPWRAYLAGAPVFAAGLFVWFGAITELLPPNF